jgi:pimeloyl-ACP methyl ester carboxylesterase
MKTLKRLLLFTTCICFLTTCSKDNDFFGSGQNDLNYNAEKYCKPYHGLDQDRYVVMRSTGLRVHYRIIGKGPIDMVFIPGWTNPLTVYTKQFEYFRDKARCIYIDLPGHGMSDAPEGVEYTQALMADAIYEVVRKEGVKKFIGVGFSWGHSPLTQFEIKHPGMIIQLMLLDIGIQTWPPLTEVSRLATYNSYLNMTDIAKLAALNGLIPPATAPPDLLEWGKYFLEYPNWLMANMYYHYLAEEVCQPYPWTIPVMVIYRNMPAGGPKELRTRLYYPNCEIHVIGGTQHCIQWVSPEIVNLLMDEFMIDRPGRKY